MDTDLEKKPEKVYRRKVPNKEKMQQADFKFESNAMDRRILFEVTGLNYIDDEFSSRNDNSASHYLLSSPSDSDSDYSDSDRDHNSFNDDFDRDDNTRGRRSTAIHYYDNNMLT